MDKSRVRDLMRELESRVEDLILDKENYDQALESKKTKRAYEFLIYDKHSAMLEEQISHLNDQMHTLAS